MHLVELDHWLSAPHDEGEGGAVSRAHVARIREFEGERDSQLLSALRAGNVSAFEQLFYEYATPLLLMHGDHDTSVPFAQAVELFSALRRLQKPVWLLSYDGEGHILMDPANQRDFTMRQAQFFDHYLKGAPAPTWMTRGIPANKKGIQSGFSYEHGHMAANKNDVVDVAEQRLRRQAEGKLRHIQNL